MPFPGDILDGYTLIRPIGAGGFGEVWLCRSDSMRDWRALKFIPAANGSALDKEHEALVRYRRAAAQLRSPHLTPIEHINKTATGLFYIMPLADGGGAGSPESPDWHPYTLGTYIAKRRAESAWFTSAEVAALFAPVLNGLQCLADAGLVHRDIKPDNLLFFGGKACLGDISLMTDDRTQVTRHGTPGYSTPSWFTGGHHDMYGAAATLYTLLTGNSPDRMGRVAFMWPPQGEASLTAGERNEWLRLHAVVRRAIEENPAERFTDFAAFARALGGEEPIIAALRPRRVSPALVAGGVALLVLLAGTGVVVSQSGKPEAHAGIASAASRENKSDVGVAHAAEYAALLAEDAKALADYDQKLTEFARGTEPALTRLLQQIRDCGKLDPDSPAFDEALKKINAGIKELTPGEDNSPVGIWTATIRTCGELEAKAANLATNAEEKFYYERNIAPKFSIPPGGVSRVEAVAAKWAGKIKHRPIGMAQAGAVENALQDLMLGLPYVEDDPKAMERRDRLIKLFDPLNLSAKKLMLSLATAE